MLPTRLARILALIGGLLVGVLAILRLLDRGFSFAFDRPFHPVYDTAYAGSALDLLGDSIGGVGTIAVFIGAGLLCLVLLAVLPLSAVRLTRLVARYKRPSIRIVAVLAAIALVPRSDRRLGQPVRQLTSTSAARLATQVPDDLRDQREFYAGARA